MPLTKAMHESINIIKNDMPLTMMMTAVEKIRHYHPKLSSIGVQEMLYKIFPGWDRKKVNTVYYEYQSINPDDTIYDVRTKVK